MAVHVNEAHLNYDGVDTTSRSLWSGEDRLMFEILVGGKQVGFIDLELERQDSEMGSIAIYIEPGSRRHGYAYKAMDAFLHMPWEHLKEVVAYVSTTNVASMSLFARFSRLKTSEDDGICAYHIPVAGSPF